MPRETSGPYEKQTNFIMLNLSSANQALLSDVFTYRKRRMPVNVTEYINLWQKEQAAFVLTRKQTGSLI
jgi:uncharacterized protein (DUF927 family)